MNENGNDKTLNQKDKIFCEKRDVVLDFNFGKDTTAVFDDMLNRSVPFYKEVQRMLCEIAADFAKDGTSIYDIGCSTGTTLINIDRHIRNNVRFIGIDSSIDMLEKAKKRLTDERLKHEWEFVQSDINNGIQINNASIVIMSLTLQFVRPLYRTNVIRAINRGLNEDGCLILFEKVIGESSIFNRLFIKYYYDMKKRNGYTEMEIAQKREALENILIPYRLNENKELLLENGFRYFDVFFKWYNFCGMLAIK